MRNELVSRTHEGWPHDHSSCPLAKNITGDPTHGPEGRITHIATPVNPRRIGRMISIGGMREVQYLGFEDFVPDPKKDPSMPPQWVHGRPFTTTIKDKSVSDICFRSVPIDKYMREVELPRICAVGCRLTYAANSWSKFVHYLPYFRSLGPIIHHEIIYNSEPPFQGWIRASHVAVVNMLLHSRL